MNILLAVDDSSHSRAAAQFMNGLRFPARSKLYLVAISEAPTTGGRLPSGARQQLSAMQHYAATQAEQFVQSVAESVWQPELKIISQVRTGIPGGQILEAIEDEQIHLTVLGTHGRTGRERFLLGSVSEWVLTESPSSVLIVRGSASDLPPSTKPWNVVVALDHSEHSTTTIRFLQRLQFPRRSHMLLCTVISEHRPMNTELAARQGKAGANEVEEFFQDIRQNEVRAAQKLLDGYAAKLQNTQIKVSTEVRHGHPAEELLTIASERNADLVALGSRGVTGLRKFFMGSVSNKVAAHAPCSVLVVRKSSS